MEKKTNISYRKLWHILWQLIGDDASYNIGIHFATVIKPAEHNTLDFVRNRFRFHPYFTTNSFGAQGKSNQFPDTASK